MAETGELRVRISAQDQASSVIGTVKKSIIGLGVAWVSVAGARKLVDTMKDTVNTFTQYTSEIDKANKVTGIATGTLQELAYAAKQEHGSFEALQKGLMNLTVRLGYAGDGLETYTRYFRQLGIEYRKADGTLRDTYDVFLNISDVVKKGNLSTEELAATMQLFGARSAKELIPMLKKGSEWFKEMAKEARDLNIVLKDGTIVQGKELADVFTRIAERGEGIKLMVAEKMLPAFETLLPIFEDYVKWATKLINVYDPLFKAVEKLYNMSLTEEQQKLRLLDLWKQDLKEKRANELALKAQAEAELAAAAASAEAELAAAALVAQKKLMLDLTEAQWAAEAMETIELDEATEAKWRAGEAVDALIVSQQAWYDLLAKEEETYRKAGTEVETMGEKFEKFASAEILGGISNLGYTITSFITDPIMQAARASGDLVEMLKAIIAQQILMMPFKLLGFATGLPFFQHGGYSPGYGIVEPKEFVMQPQAVQSIGRDNLERMNRGDTFNSPITVNVNVSGSGSGSRDGYAISQVLEHELPRVMKNLERRRKL